MADIFPISDPEKDKDRIDDPVTVMTFNLRFGLAKDGPHAWEYASRWSQKYCTNTHATLSVSRRSTISRPNF
jgi:hypothetical protein